MTWSYGKNPQNNKLDEVRVLGGDVDETQPLVDDEIITYFLVAHTNAKSAAVETCRYIAHRFSMMGKGRLEGYEWDFTSIVEQTQARIIDLLASTTPYTFFGGLSYSERQSNADNTDLIPSRFRRSMHDNNGCE